MWLKYILLIVALSNLALGVFVWSQNPRKSLNRYFALFAIFTGIWVLSNFISQFITDINLLETTYILGLFLVLFAIIWSYFLLNEYPSVKFRIIVWTIFLTNIIFSYLMFATDIFISSINTPTDYQTGPMFIIFGSYMLSLLFGYVIYLIYLYKKSPSVKKNQLKYVILGLCIFIFTSAFVSFIIPSIVGSTKYSFLDSVSSFVFVGLSSYSILVHHLFDIRVIIKKTIVYSVLLLFVLVVYSFIVLSATVLLGGNVSILGEGGVFTARIIIPNIIAAILIALGFDPLKNWLSRVTDNWLYKGEYKSEDVLSKLSENLSTVIDLNEALISMMRTITDAMRIDNSAVVVLRKSAKEQEGSDNPDGKNLEVSRVRAIGVEIDEKSVGTKVTPLIKYFEKNPDIKIVITEDLERQSISKNFNDIPVLMALKELKIALAMPINIKDKMIGIFLLGAKLSGDIFNDKDLNLLDIAVKQTAAAIEKARFYEEDQLKSEFVSIASHELLTPTSAIEGYLSMILDEKLAKVDKKAEGYLRKVYDSSKRLAILVKDLLNVSRIESGRIIIQWQAFDIINLIKNVIEELEPKAKEKNLKLLFVNPKSEILNLKQIQNSNDKNSKQIKDTSDKQSPEEKIKVFADEERCHQILVNLIGNAIKYTQEGSVTVSYEIKEIDQNKYIEIAVTDTGIGIHPDDQKHLFEKFYRASNANKFGAGGTGLGLYISRNLAELMDGRIWLRSAEGKGSTFYLDLKIATEEQILKHSEKPVGPGVIPYKKQS